MNKLYVLTIALIVVITVGFLLFYCDENTVNKRFLATYGIEISAEPTAFEELQIPKEFDEMYENYNFLQIQSGLNLSPHKGKRAVRYTYRVLNAPKELECELYANVICINHRPVAGDINCPALAGFIEPLTFLQLHY
ncbi:MAG: DUF4830 domain-containing protein [Clostridia bacterium]|nr:DUF4830 domain-containing protein [Clostridia bacterium]